ncbi:hypothetical protein BGX33_002582 [Mortierella sp. NVP41]|nr:hypothetical protein BGX33_002582 [Mortierella sp. NVP41]
MISLHSTIPWLVAGVFSFGVLHLSFMKSMSSIELAINTLALVLLPKAIGSFANLKDERSLIYYLIWFKMMTNREKDDMIPNVLFDALIALNMDCIYRHHLTTLVGEKGLPESVYYSSFIFNSRLDAYLAEHVPLDTSEDQDEGTYPNEKLNMTVANQELPDMTNSTRTKATNMTRVYLIVATAFALNTGLSMFGAYREYSCSYGGHYTTREYLLEFFDINNKTSFCFPRRRYTYTDLHPSLPLPETIVIRTTALLVALAWSTLSTQTIIRAWARMWNSNNNTGYLRKIHYVIYMLPVKALSYYLIKYNTVPFAPDNGSNRNVYLLVWTYLFGHGIDLVFGLILLWNLYLVHTLPGDTVATESRPSQRGLLFGSDEKKDDRSNAETSNV